MDKKKIFDNLVKMLTKNKVMSNVNTEENDVSYIVSFLVYGDIACNLSMRKVGNICVAKADCVPKADDEADPSVIANDIIQGDENIRFTVYDGKIVLQRVIPFEDNDNDKDIEETLRTAIKGFFNLFIDHAELLECNFKADKHADADHPVNDQDSSDTNIVDDNMDIEDSSIDDEDYGEDELDDMTDAGDFDQEDNIVDDENPPEGGEQGDHIKTSNTKKTESPDNDDDLDAMLDALQAIETTVKPAVLEAKGTKNKTKKGKVQKGISKTKPAEDQVVTTDQSHDYMLNSEDCEESDAFAKQLQNMYQEFDEIFKNRESALDARESKLNKYADTLQTQEQQIKATKKELEEERKSIRSEVEAEFNSAREKLEHEKKVLAIATKQLDLDRKKVTMEQTTIETQRKALEEEIALNKQSGAISDDSEYKQEIKELQGQISTLQTEVTQLRGQNTQQNNTIVQQNAIIEKFKVKRDEWAQEKNDLLDQIEEIQSTPVQESSSEDNITVAEHKAELKKKNNRIKELEDRINTLSVERDSLESEKQSLKAQINQLNTEKAHLENEKMELTTQMGTIKAELNSAKSSSDEESKDEPEDLTVAAKDIIDTTKALGIHLEIVAGNAEMILAGEHEACTICVNVAAGMLYIEKPVKKTSQYLDIVEKWNGEDIRYAYFLGKDKVICKCKYDNNAAKAMNEVITKINTI